MRIGYYPPTALEHQVDGKTLVFDSESITGDFRPGYQAAGTSTMRYTGTMEPWAYRKTYPLMGARMGDAMPGAPVQMPAAPASSPVETFAPPAAGLAAAALSYRKSKRPVRAALVGAGVYFLADFLLGFVRGLREAAQGVTAGIAQVAVPAAFAQTPGMDLANDMPAGGSVPAPAPTFAQEEMPALDQRSPTAIALAQQDVTPAWRNPKALQGTRFVPVAPFDTEDPRLYDRHGPSFPPAFAPISVL